MGYISIAASLHRSLSFATLRRLTVWFLLLYIGLGQSESLAQIYITNTNTSANFQLVLIETGATTLRPNRPTTAAGQSAVLAGVGSLIYSSSTGNTLLRIYNLPTSSWSSQSGVPEPGGALFTDGANLYQRLGTDGLTAAGISKYNSANNTWTTVGAVGSVNAVFSGVGVIYFFQGGSVKKYDGTTVTTLTAQPGDVPNNAICTADANNLYCLSSTTSSGALHIYHLATNSWTLAPTNTPAGFASGFFSTGNDLYGKNGTTIYSSSISGSTISSTWITVTSSALAGGTSQASTLDGSFYVPPPAPPCAVPVVTASITQATCAGATANANGTLTLTSFNTNAKRVDYSIGSTYTGAGFNAATPLTGSAPYTVANTLPNPAVNQPYTVRVFCDASTYIDRTVILSHRQCQSANLSLSINPATKTGNLAEQLSYTVTLTNSGPDAATNVKVSVPMPTPTASFLAATTGSGTYDELTHQWTVPSLPVGSTTLTFTVKVNKPVRNAIPHRLLFSL